MSVELKWYLGTSSQTGSEIYDYIDLVGDGITSYDLTIRNIGDKTAKNVGFYLAESSLDPFTEIDVIYPSTKGTVIDRQDLLDWGTEDISEGYIITQSGVSETVSNSLGNSATTPIPLTLGSTQGEIGVDEEVTVQIIVSPPVSAGPQRKYVGLEITYTED